MGIIVNKKRFTGKESSKVVKEILEEIKFLPEPEVIQGVKEFPDEKEVVLCLKREALYLNNSNPGNKIQYIGTKDLHPRILIYLYNEFDHAILHCDDSTCFNFDVLLQNFSEIKNIHVSLVGGKKDASLSKKIIENILLSLYETAEQLGVDITIDSQKLLDRNQFSEEDRYQFIYDKIIYKADILSRQFFNKALDIRWFNERKISVLDLKRGKSVDSFQLESIAALISQANEVYEKNKAAVLKFIYSNTIKTEEQFYRDLLNLFSYEGFKLIDPGYSNKNLYNDTKLSSFVFDCKQNKICIISNHIKMPHEKLREIFPLDFSQKLYHLVYTSPEIAIKAPQLSEKFTKACQRAHKFITEKQRYKEEVIDEFKECFNITNIGVSIHYINLFIRFLKDEFPILQSKAENVGGTTDEAAKKHYQNGVAAYKLKQYERAIALLESAADFYKKNKKQNELATCYSTLASCYRELKEHDKALECCSKALSIYPHEVKYLKKIFTCCPTEEKFLKKLFSCLPESTKEASESKQLMSTQAERYIDEGEYKLAIIIFEQLEEKSSFERIGDCYFKLGETFEKEENDVDAWLNFEKAKKYYAKSLGSDNEKTKKALTKEKASEEKVDKTYFNIPTLNY